MKIIFILISLTFFVGCASTLSPSIPDGYSGEIATVDDSFNRRTKSKADLFFLGKIDGKVIHNNFIETSRASSGKGFNLVAVGASRPVPAKPLKLFLVGTLHHAAPIGYALNSGSNYRVEGEIEFTLKPGARYLVNGTLSEKYSAVWIENTKGEIVSKIVEKKSEGHVEKTFQKKADLESSAPLTREEHFATLVSGQSAELVKAKLGEPDKISSQKPNFFIEREASITYEYSNLGKIIFIARDPDSPFVQKIIPFSKNTDDISIMQKQLENTGIALQGYAKSYFQFESISEEKLDLFAKKIWEERNTEDPYTADALAWLCKVLAKSQNPRYRSLLANIAENAGSKKLRRHGKSTLELLPPGETDQFLAPDK